MTALADLLRKNACVHTRCVCARSLLLPALSVEISDLFLTEYASKMPLSPHADAKKVEKKN